MNLKKFISGVSALTIAASAFAGVTAMAAEGDVIENASAKISDGTYGDFSLTSATIKDGWLYVPKASGTLTVADDQLAGPNDVVVVKFKVAYGKLSGRSFYFNIADSDGDKAVDFNFTPYTGTINTNVLGDNTNLPKADDWYYGYNTPLTERSIDYTITFDFANDKVTQYTTCLKSGAGKSATEATYTNNLPASIDNVKTLTIGSNYDNADRYCAIQDLSITTTKGADATTADYTVNYKLGDTVVKSVTLNGIVAQQVAPELASFEVDGQRYFCVSNDADGTVIAADGSTVVTVIVREAATYTVSTAASTGASFGSASVVEGDSYTYTYPKYLTDANNNVIATADATTFAETVTPTDDTTYTVPYTAYDGVAIAVEPSSGTSASTASKFSNANAYRGWDGEITSVTIPEDGEYQVSMNVFSNNVNHDAHAIAKVGEKEIMNENVKLSVNYPTVKTSEKVMLKAGDVITISTDSKNLAVDYILVEKTGDYVAPTPNLGATITDQGTENGTETFANDSATWFIITVANTGDAEGSYNTVSITDNTDTFNAEVANATLDAGASIVYGGVVQNAYTFTGASVN